MRCRPYQLVILCAILLLSGCAAQQLVTRGTAQSDEPRLELRLVFNPENYPWLMRTAYPTFAIWVQRADGNNACTLYVSGKAGRDKWIGAKERPSAAPVWRQVRESEGATFNVDAVSGATPAGESFELRWPIPAELRNAEIELYVEANVSFDYNERYPRGADEGQPGYSSVNGQPSLVWRARFLAGDEALQAIPCELAGHGHVLGADHAIDPDLEGITTATAMFRRIELNYQPGD